MNRSARAAASRTIAASRSGSTTISLLTAEGQLVAIAKEQIEARKSGKSSMPEDLLKHLTKAELRDLVEFLANVR